MSQPRISLILPVCNQADHIARVIEEYTTTLAPIPAECEILLVVNGSSDASHAVCQALAAERPALRVLHSAAGGWGLAVRLGLRAAGGDILAYTNTARTSPRDLQLLLLTAICNPGFVVKANRKVRESTRRRLGSLLYNLECRMLFDLPYWDINGTPKVFPRSFDRLLALERDDDLIDAEFHVVCRRAGYPMLEVPIFSTRRHGGRSTTRWGSALRMYWGAYALWRNLDRAQG